MTAVMYLSQQHGRRGQIDVARKRESRIVLTYIGEIKFVAFLLAREFDVQFDGFHSLSLRVESKVSLSSC